MVNTELQKIIREQYKTLPKDVRDALLAVDLRKKLETITERQHLHLDQAGALENETLFIMLGLEHPKDYIRNVARELNITTDAAKKIAFDVNEQIFRPIRESLKKIHSIDELTTSNQQLTTDNRQPTTTEVAQKPKTAEREAQNNLQPTTYNLQPAAEDHPILRLKKTSQEAKNILAKKELPKKPLTGGGEVVGWPVKSLTKRTAFSVQGLDEKIKLNAKPSTLNATKDWEPKQPEKEASAPENLPVETEKNGAPKTGTYPSIKTAERETQNVERESQDVLRSTLHDTQKTGGDSVAEKLSSSFKLPRTETEYREKRMSETAKKQGYAGGDPYRESVD